MKRGHYVMLWELHLGPQDEFALYDHWVQGEHSHEDPQNLLMPAYRVEALTTYRGARQWTVPKLHLWLSVVRAGGSREDCQSFVIRIEQRRGH